MQQAGIKNITLYENNGISITYDSAGDISSLSTTGNTITLDECINVPMFEFKSIPAKNNVIMWEYLITAILNDISIETYDKLDMLIESIYGWKPKLELQSGDIIFLNDPFFATSDDVNTNETHTYFLEIQPRLMSINKPLYFT